MAYTEQDKMTKTLRFALGTEVQCNVGNWVVGRVSKQWYRDSKWPPGRYAAYQVRITTSQACEQT